jgi:hypothetical protein
MWRNMLILAATAGLSIAVAGNADAQRISAGAQGGANVVGTQGGANVKANAGVNEGRMTTARTRAGMNARAQVRGPGFRPLGWSHGRKTGWHCRVGARTCIPPGQR